VAYEDIKLLLAQAATVAERTEAIRAAISQGIPINQIEEYLDWFDTVHSLPPGNKEDIGGPHNEDKFRTKSKPPTKDIIPRTSSRFHIAHPAKWWHIVSSKVTFFLTTTDRRKKR
jgi:hypothetical protein